jgi:transposase
MDDQKPTSSETSVAQRQQMVALAAQGWSYAAIAADLGCSTWTVGRWVRAHRRGGDDALTYHSRRPLTSHPLTTSAAVQAEIRTIHETHPGWGARLLRRQLDLDRITPLPSETTIHAWLRRWGEPLVRPLRHKPLGFAQPAKGATPCWEVDFKAKGGPST